MFYLRLVRLFLALLAVTPQPPAADARPIYGEDNRRDMYEVSDPEILKLGKATVALFSKKNVQIEGDFSRLIGKPLGKEYKLAHDEKFYDQPSGALCSGVLIGRDLVLTAGHCVPKHGPHNCRSVRFVFDYAIWEKGRDPSRVPTSDVYSCAKVLKREGNGLLDFIIHPNNEEFALVRLDRAVLDREPAPLSDAEIQPGYPIFTLGYPVGLPLKFADDATVRPTHEVTFVSNVDAFHGNSGSPIFDSKSKRVVGILTAALPDAAEDFINTEKGIKSNVHPQSSYEQIGIRITAIVQKIRSKLESGK